MANPTVRRSVNRDRRSGQAKLPLVTRRFAAWAVEVSLIISSALVPYALGAYTNSLGLSKQVPLNPVLAKTEAVIASKMGLRVEESRSVPPLTNILWAAALVLPVMVLSWQLLLLATTGSTLPKRWFGVRVVSSSGLPPGMWRVVLREIVATWIPVAIAYLWCASVGFPSLSTFVGLSCFLMFAEGTSARFQRQRQCLHDLLAGTYVIDANRVIPVGGRLSTKRVTSVNGNRTRNFDADVVTTIIVSENHPQPSFTSWIRQHPILTLMLVSLLSVAAALATVAGNKIYQQQVKQRQQNQQSDEFFALVKQLSFNAATISERQQAIIALAALNDPRAVQLLVNLLTQETNPVLLDTIYQAIATTGLRALPYLQRLNQSLSNQIETKRSQTSTPDLQLTAQRLQATQQVIANILQVYSGKLYGVDLSNVNFSQTLTDSPFSFSLMLDNIDLSGIRLRSANLNYASFQNSRWRSAGADSRWDTADDVVADLSNAQLKAANFTNANLSRVLLNRSNLIRATLNNTNLAGAKLVAVNLSSAQMIAANLRNANLEDASLTGADLGAADLTSANLSAARLGRVNAVGVQLQSANLSASEWQGADLSAANLSRANLQNADFSATQLRGVNFHDAQMQNVRLRNTDLRQADLRGANLAQADFQGAIFYRSPTNASEQITPLPPPDAPSTLVAGVDFSTAKNLDAKQLAYICVQGGRHPRCP